MQDARSSWEDQVASHDERWKMSQTDTNLSGKDDLPTVCLWFTTKCMLLANKVFVVLHMSHIYYQLIDGCQPK